MRRVFSTAVPVVLAGEVRQSKRRRRAALDGEEFVSGIPRGRRMRRSPHMVQIKLQFDCRQMWRMPFDFHASRYSTIELAAMATIVVSVAAIAYLLFSIWAAPPLGPAR